MPTRSKKKHAGRDGKGTVASMLRWLLRRVLRRALGTEEELKLPVAGLQSQGGGRRNATVWWTLGW